MQSLEYGVTARISHDLTSQDIIVIP